LKTQTLKNNGVKVGSGDRRRIATRYDQLTIFAANTLVDALYRIKL
jgi:hypothetical protein